MSSAPVEGSFSDLLAGLVRGDPNEFLHLLKEYEIPTALDGTRTVVRTHFLAVDAGGTPAVDLLASAMARAAMDFCIPRARVEEAVEYLQRTRSTSHFSRLEQQARELFVDADGTGEGGELLLFLLMERLLGLPQLLAKMSLKTSSNVHVHGSDGVHASLGEDGILDVYWGESKLYKSSSDAFTDCFESIAPFLAADGAETRKRDLLLVRDNLNVQHADLASHLLEYFDESSPRRLKVRWNGACLVGFDHGDYPNLDSLEAEQSKQLSNAVQRWRAAVGRRLTQHNLVQVGIDVFCIPVPDVDALRKAVRAKLGVS
ncbi:DUF1837 domain-containing protein [Pseudarthrobacter sp. NPDC092184]|jgi:Cap4 SAVED domain|uniref:HamA C-terminal domain-containing protein n=1 Tax=unclassified Pseudarthrobacter TaxID=2647000 RepID=UPI003804EB1D